mgnify:CR=1 FL=1
MLPEAGLGGSVVLLADQLRAVRLDLFRQTPGNHVEPPAFDATDESDPFLAELSAAVDLTAAPWQSLSVAAGVTMLERQRMVRRRRFSSWRDLSREYQSVSFHNTGKAIRVL